MRKRINTKKFCEIWSPELDLLFLAREVAQIVYKPVVYQKDIFPLRSFWMISPNISVKVVCLTCLSDFNSDSPVRNTSSLMLFLVTTCSLQRYLLVTFNNAVNIHTLSVIWEFYARCFSQDNIDNLSPRETSRPHLFESLLTVKQQRHKHYFNILSCQEIAMTSYIHFIVNLSPGFLWDIHTLQGLKGPL